MSKVKKKKRTITSDEDVQENPSTMEFEVEDDENFLSLETISERDEFGEETSEIESDDGISLSIPTLSIFTPSELSTQGTTYPAPISWKIIKRRKITDFIYFETPWSWHPLPDNYSFPVFAVVSPKSKLARYEYPQPFNTNVNSPMIKKTEEPEEASMESVDDHGSDVAKIIEALKSLGGSGTGAQITSWITKNYGDSSKKRMGYTVNAVLSSKKHSPLFLKETVVVDGNKRALWRLAENAMISPDTTSDMHVEDITGKEEERIEDTREEDEEFKMRAYVSWANEKTFGGKEILSEDEEETDVEKEKEMDMNEMRDSESEPKDISMSTEPASEQPLSETLEDVVDEAEVRVEQEEIKEERDIKQSEDENAEEIVDDVSESIEGEPKPAEEQRSLDVPDEENSDGNVLLAGVNDQDEQEMDGDKNEDVIEEGDKGIVEIPNQDERRDSKEDGEEIVDDTEQFESFDEDSQGEMDSKKIKTR